MFRLAGKPFLIICLILIDLLLILSIHVNNKSLPENSGQEIKSQTLTKQSEAVNNKKAKVEGSGIIVGKIILTPTLFGSPKPTAKAATTIPTLNPTTVPTATPGVEAQTQTQTTISNTSLSQQLLDQVNEFRASKGLSKAHSDGYTCAFATTRANEIVGNFSHDGFNNRANSHTLPYPSYSSVTENIALNSDPMQVVNAWIASPGHNENMQKDTPNVCIANSGNYYAYEGWKP